MKLKIWFDYGSLVLRLRDSVSEIAGRHVKGSYCGSSFLRLSDSVSESAGRQKKELNVKRFGLMTGSEILRLSDSVSEIAGR